MNKQPITILGRQKLGQELHDLKMVQRPQTVKEIDIAREHGDLKENAEYHAAREKLRFIEARMAELADLYDSVQEIDPSKFPHDKVMFGSTITVENMDTEAQATYTIVGTYESNPDKGLISSITPLARQLMGKEEGDEVTVKLPGGEVEYEIVSIAYQEITF
ncbi:MAG: transcription elongation factor GreA [Epsilonproteobacteria bacterium]|nr:transcription elongation factor GreA [Campylobacterota bacterium]